MSNIRFVLLACFVLIIQSSLAQKEYLDQVLAIVEKSSINRDSLDFGKIRKESYEKLGLARTPEDSYPAVRFILSQLNDHHSFLMVKQKVLELRRGNRLLDRQ